jgi:hypothetical protein
MLRPTRTELVLFFLLGVACFAAFETVFSFQSLNCSPQEQSAGEQNPGQQTDSAKNHRDNGNEKEGNQTVSQPFSCSIAGTPTAVRIFMNHNEGFLVGSFTFLLAFATIYLVRATNRLWIGAEESAESQSRAYISVATGAGWRQGQAKGLKFEFRPVFKNVGQTPAYDVTVACNIKFVAQADIEGFDYEANLVRPTISTGLTLGKDQDRFTHAILDRGLTKAELRQYRRGTHTLLVFGSVRYRDAFRRNRYANFSYMIGWWAKRGLPTWHSTARHNDSD